MTRLRLLAGLALLCLPPLALAQEGCVWPQWQQFKDQHLSADGRVIDPSQGDITTSEGQAYALFFALVANDRAQFRQLLEWTENNLAQGDLQRHLPAWKWGRTDAGDWAVLDPNNASDAELWLAYSLLEADRLWQQPDYRELAHNLLWRVAAQTLRKLPDLGVMLLPGDEGFVSTEGTRLNTSYLPLQLLARFAQIDPLWAELADNAARLLALSAPAGLAPDWLLWRSDGAVALDTTTGPRGSYDAIRVYLWLGMLDPQVPQRAALLQHYRRMAELTAGRGIPPETVDVMDGSAEGQGPVGFSAALLPLLAALDDTATLQTQRQRVAQLPVAGYYNQVLSLFGRGWDEQRYRFDDKGWLIPAWNSSCAN